MASEKPPASGEGPAKPLSLSERIKALTARAAARATDAAKEGAAAEAPAKEGAATRTPAKRAAAAPAKEAAAPATRAAAAPAAAPPAPEAGTGTRKLSLTERLKALAAGKVPPAAAAAAPPAAGTAAPPAPAATAPPAAPAERARPAARPARAPAAPPAKPAPPAPPAKVEPAAPAAEPEARPAERVAARAAPPEKAPPAKAPPAERVARPAPAPRPRPVLLEAPAAPEPEEAAQAAAPAAPSVDKPRTYSPYVDDDAFILLPSKIQRIILEASNEEGVVPVKRALRNLQGPELAGKEELVVGFVENITSTLRQRFFAGDDEIERRIFFEPSGDLSIRTGDGEVKVRGKCWEFFFVWRSPRELGKDRRATLQAMIEEVFTFGVRDTSVSKMKVEEPVEFDEDTEAHYFEASLDTGGWCELRFEAAAAFTDGRVMVAAFEPRVIRSKDLPPPKTISPKEFVALLNKNRRRA